MQTEANSFQKKRSVNKKQTLYSFWITLYRQPSPSHVFLYVIICHFEFKINKYYFEHRTNMGFGVRRPEFKSPIDQCVSTVIL